jgi:Rrf2 family protein
VKISTKGEYGIRSMVYLAMHSGDRRIPIQMHEISEHQGIPKPYLKQILASLKREGLVHSVRGPTGGHTLARPAGEITIAEILLALEGSLTGIDDILTMPCHIDIGPEHCAIKELWVRAKLAVEKVLSSTSLEDLCQRQQTILSQNIFIPTPTVGPHSRPPG